jgi:poly-beta-1,6-N-acetyl-D-glucosamine synthase
MAPTLFLFLYPWIVLFSVLYLMGYGLLHYKMYYFWQKSLVQPSQDFGKDSVALLIPFRNEKDNIQGLISDLAIRIPGHWEVILIDDHSEDVSYQLVDTQLRTGNLTNFRMLKSDGQGKKAALSKGVFSAKAEIIITLDADIRLPGHNPWGTLLAYFSDKSVQLVAGPIFPINATGYFAAFQCYEWASVLLVTGASFAIKNPLMCSGANLAFRKAAFFEVGGYSGNESLLSGDDEFLLKKMILHFGQNSVKFANTPHAAVYFTPFKELGGLIQQRARWASKWNAHGKNFHFYVAILLFLVAVYPFITLYFVLAGFEGFKYFFAFWVVKLCADYMVLGRVVQTFRQKPSVVGLLITGALHPFYVLAIGWRIVSGSVSWKGRKIK